MGLCRVFYAKIGKMCGNMLKYDADHFRTIWAKHLGHAGMSFWSLSGIWQVNFYTFQRTAIISSSTGSRALYTALYVLTDLPVANIDVSFVITASVLK